MNEAGKIQPMPIGLPNGSQTVASKQGSVVLGENIKLKRVLYLLNLNCNLVSVANLSKDSNCTLTFSNDFCVLRDCTSRTLIRVGEQRDGVYYYKEAPGGEKSSQRNDSKGLVAQPHGAHFK